MYLDYNATTPVDAQVVAALLPFLSDTFGNASSSYALGVDAKRAVEQARAQIAQMLGAATRPDEIVFLSGGTESINYALKGSAQAARRDSGRNHIITCATEHVAVLETCRHLETQDFDVTYLPVDEYGQVRVQDVVDAITPATFLVSIMHANNEVGTLQPIADISRAIKSHVNTTQKLPILFHTDASQSVGKVRVDVDDLRVDFLTIAGHKLYAPKGIGALYIRAGTPLPSVLVHGASHESGKRAGTENVPYDVALGKACAMIHEHIGEYGAHMQRSKEFLLAQLQSLLQDSGVTFRVNGHPEQVLPNTLSISFKNISAVKLLRLIEEQGVCASAGSACHSHCDDQDAKVSHVLAAMKLPREFALGTLRLSVGRHTTEQELVVAAAAIHHAICQLV
uniref:cysteine desulfurase n=1 Tax=Globisporangium ultimum (strain ATCC 200006 / CBS 805.95 / DAOM BR144) TaxID=431595 RepID=K3X836_GLOUD